jgi:integrase
MIVRLKHVKRVTAKGRTYWYHRVTNERLPDDREARAARVLEVNATLKGTTAHKIAPGSLADVITQYKRSGGFRELRERTRKNYTPYLELLRATWGEVPVYKIERHHIIRLQEKYFDTPAKANMIVSILRIVLDFAVDRNKRTGNPAVRIKRFKTGPGHKPWSQGAQDRFLSVAPPMMVAGFMLALYTGQRLGDVIAMSWHDYDGKRIKVVQSKTGEKLSITAHDDLKEVLDAMERVSPIILTTVTGKPFEASNFGKSIKRALKAAGFNALSTHGLRYTAASKLAEIGLSAKLIGSITGHRSLAMIEKYSRGANQEIMADAAILAWNQDTSRTKNRKLH